MNEWMAKLWMHAQINEALAVGLLQNMAILSKFKQIRNQNDPIPEWKKIVIKYSFPFTPTQTLGFSIFQTITICYSQDLMF